MAQPSTRRRAADLAALNAPSGPNWLPSTPRDGVSDSLPLNAVGAVAQTLNAARRPHRQRGRIDNDMVLSTPAGYRPHRPLSLSTPHRADVPLNAAAAPFSAPALYNAARQLPDAFNAWHFRSRCSTPCAACETPSTLVMVRPVRLTAINTAYSFHSTPRASDTGLPLNASAARPSAQRRNTATRAQRRASLELPSNPD